ncbi:hypothetical protein PTSG_11091 [Salpingoeca rosetta]|uniref:Partial AB-hydrolase lipase domain-containing protein n=1 Tax=Salpingoeca rosetta (strain ATCC 50818 / BSB-021) TaxID=946362 RepID=F2US41_SALR5|nr:uncharacterized protein PTSG_11091 [Salpingoeca rosetta]EGD80446.1 hypothetical protein PTSG_11091 [Salpingoeca rosetta]|eukprot:XP_004988010.1 hypothetical protein PTSG_11091 [Salpingoeca rosetta]
MHQSTKHPPSFPPHNTKQRGFLVLLPFLSHTDTHAHARTRTRTHAPSFSSRLPSVMALYPTRLGQLSLADWIKLSFALVIVVVEAVTRLLLFVLPAPLIAFIDSNIVSFVKRVSVFSEAHVFQGDTIPPSEDTHNLSAVQLAQHFGFFLEQHVVLTKDGFQLALHRLRQPEMQPRKGVVFLQHGLMQCSEAWLCTRDSFAYLLFEEGYDVWMGNSRGNKYSCKHMTFKPHDPAFWDFSIDEMAANDLPASIDHVLASTGASSLSYVGFSQGTALGFAAFSLNQQLAHKIDVFVALAPAAKALGLRQGFLQTLVHLAPQSIFLVFGTRSLMPWVMFWRSVLTRRVYARLIESGCQMLFDWRMDQLGDQRRRLMLYSHLFSLTSVKTIVHWFQIVASDTFQQYDDNREFRSGYRLIEQQQYPLNQMPCPVVMMYGGADRLTDILWMKRNLPEHSAAGHIRIPNYEHLDLMWAADAEEKVLPHVIAAIERFRRRQTALDAFGESGNEATATHPQHPQHQGHVEGEEDAVPLENDTASRVLKRAVPAATIPPTASLSG